MVKEFFKNNLYYAGDIIYLCFKFWLRLININFIIEGVAGVSVEDEAEGQWRIRYICDLIISFL